MGTDYSTRRGVLTSSSYPPSLAERTLRRQIPKVGAQCVNHARWDLCGGCSEMGIPPAIQGRWGPSLCGHVVKRPFLAHLLTRPTFRTWESCHIERDVVLSR